MASNRIDGELMRFLGKSKIGRLTAKKGKIYPQIRLPPRLTDTIGEIADVFETERNGKRAFLLVTKQSVLHNDTVLQPNKKVVKPNGEIDNDHRFEALESQISELKSLLLLNEGDSLHKNKNETDSEWARPDSNRRPPPCQGDVITD
jgi:hypothetical protein